MKTESIVRMTTGAVVLTSVLLSRYHNPNWVWLAAFVGFALFQAPITGICPSEIVIRKIRGESAN